ncbi:MAG TPA: hypothetical protein VE174_09055 [Actinomycetota bacterium]|nr:hypothetical protein [Actinomycetota bacterium]
MRARLLQLFLLIAVLGAVMVPASAVVAAPRVPIVLAQEEETDTEEGEADDSGGEGQDDPAAETGADEEAPVEEETGPPWTYQMARMSIGLILLLAIGMALLYRRLIGGRQKTGA